MFKKINPTKDSIMFTPYAKVQLNFLFSFFGAVILSTACVTPGTTVTSVPNEAEVYVLKQNGERGPLLGKTPFVVTPEMAAEVSAIEVTKKGFTTVYTLLPDINLPAKQTYAIGLTPLSKEWLTQQVVSGNNEIISQSLSELMEFQNLIQNKKNTDAEDFMKKNKEKFKNVSSFQILCGLYFYQQKQYSLSKDHFQTAINLDPKNAEASEMLLILKNIKN
jgi:tetratricopeptide (TPR) repeat protein